MSGPSSIDVQALLARQDWIERLARGLVRDSSLAQDLAQEAWLVASRKAPAEPGALRGFLAGVVRNRLRAEHRSAARRERREATAARPEALPSSADLAGRLELHRLLLESVLALDEHERTALQLCYFEGLTAEEIARRANLPASTVRSRIQRGLERLRGQLERRVDRRDLFAGLVALARLEPGVAPDVGTTLPWIGALTMKTLFSAVAACALLVVAGLWLGNRDAEAPPAPTVAHVAAPPAIVPESGRDEGLLGPLSAERTEVTGPSGRASAEPEPAPLATAPARLRARLVDENGLAVADAEVHHLEKEVGASRADGGVDIAIEGDMPWYTTAVEFRHPRFARARRYVRFSAGVEVTLGDIVLAPAGEVRGRVEDELGRPIAGARVMLTDLENLRTDPEELRRLGPLEDETSFTGTADEHGRFALAGVPVRPQRLWAGSDGYAWKALGPLEPARGVVPEEQLFVLGPLDASDRITGRVLDPEGHPVAGAKLQTWFTAANIGQGSFLDADEEGRFEVLLQQRVVHDLTVSDPENRWSEVYALGVEPGTRDLELRFSPAVFMDVRVSDGQGVPLGDDRYALELAGDGAMTVLREPAGPAGEGRTRVRVPNAAFRLTCSATGYERVERGPFEPGAAPAEIVFELTALPGIRGRVLTAEGEPAAGAALSLVGVASDRVKLERDGFRVVFEQSPVHTAEADADGRFVLYLSSPKAGHIGSGLYVVRADLAGYARTELAARAYDPREGVELELTLTHGGSIEGRALTARGVDPAGIVVAYHRGDGTVKSLRLGSDGRYRIEGLTPGPWEVRALDDELVGNRSSSSSTYYDGEPAPPMEDWTCTVVEGRTTRYDLDLTDRAPCHLAGRLVLGTATAGWTAGLEEQQRSDAQIVSAPFDADGGFELTVARAGRYRLVLRGPDEGHGRLELSETLELEPGDGTWELALPCGSVTGQGAVGRGTRERFHRYRWSGSAEGHELAAEVRIVPDAEGRFALPVVPAGRGVIERNDPPGEGQEFAPWETVATFEVGTGASRAVALP